MPAILTTLGTITVAGITAWASIAASRRSGRAERATREITAELRPNGGKSLRDAIDQLGVRLDQRISVADERQLRTDQRLDRLHGLVEDLVEYHRRQP